MRIGALETGGTEMVMAIGNEWGEIIEKKTLLTQQPEVTMPQIISYFQKWEIDKLGIGTFGPVCLDKRNAQYGYILESPKLAWRNYDILGELENGLRVPCYLDTDVNVAALGEATWGNAADAKNSIYIRVGAGIGAGIIVDRKPVHGLMHPEAGHVFVKRHVTDSFSGTCPYHQDCLEGMASKQAMEYRWGKTMEELYTQEEVWKLEAYYLAQAVVDYILILSPQRVILGGEVMRKEQLIGMVRQEVKSMLAGYICMKEMENMEEFIVPSKLHDEQGIKGCIQLTQMD